MRIETLAQLRTLFPEPGERARKKQLDRLDVHCTSFIGLSPFLVLASVDERGDVDASPRAVRSGRDARTNAGALRAGPLSQERPDGNER